MTCMRLLAAARCAMLAFPAFAQEAAAPQVPAGASASPSVTAALSLEALKPVLDENGQPLLDAEGQPTLEFQPVTDGVALLPGDEFRYIATLQNDGAEVQALEVGLDLPQASRLMPETVAASDEATFELGSTADAALREPLLVEIDGASVPNPAWVQAPERFDRLFARIDQIPSGQAARVTYHLVVR